MPACQHSGQNRVSEVHQRVDVDRDQVVLPVRVDLFQPPVGAEPRIVDQDVDHSPVESRNQGLDACLAAQVADHEVDVDARRRLLNSLLHFRQTRLVSPGEDQGQTALGELFGEECAQARARAGDDGPACACLLFFDISNPSSMLTSLTYDLMLTSSTWRVERRFPSTQPSSATPITTVI